jgi:hypothetical protein
MKFSYDCDSYTKSIQVTMKLCAKLNESDVLRTALEPTFEVVVSQSQQALVAGGRAQINCNARGNIADINRIEWSREGAELPHGGSPAISFI